MVAIWGSKSHKGGLVASFCLFFCSLLAPVQAQSSTSLTTSDTRQLYTNSVAYCSAPFALLVSDLRLHFYPGNQTLEFDLSAASVQNDLNVSIALNINAYGLGLINVNIDLCDLLGGILCPLPQYQFAGGGIFPLPESVISGIPNIAYTIPDLEALATLQLTDVNSGDIVGCVQTTLTNGHTAQQSAVVWAMVGLALLALFSSMLHSVIAKSAGAAQWRVVDVMLAIQLPAIASLLSLNYPIVFIEYGVNFAWSIGLARIQSLQDSITRTRANTGGHQTAVFGSNLTAQVATRLDPYSPGTGTANTASSGISGLQLRDVAPSIVQLKPSSSYASIEYPALVARQQYAPNTGPGGQLIGGGSNINLPIVTSNPSNNGGIGTFAERNYIAPANSYLTVLTSMAILLAIFVAALLVVYLIALLVRVISKPVHVSSSLHWSQRVLKPSYFFSTIVLATLGRFLMITFPIFFIFAFYQWAYSDSWVGHLVAGIFTVIFLAFAVGLLFPMIRHARRGDSTDLYYDEKSSPSRNGTVSRTWGQMGHMYRPRFYWFSAVFLGYSIIRACFISFAQGHGTRQAIGLLVLEILLFLVLCIFRVGRDKKSDFVFIFLCFSRIAAWAVCIAFIPSANVQTIPRVIVGFVLLVVTGLPIIFLFFLTLWDLVSPFISSRGKSRNKERPFSDEKREEEYARNTSSVDEDTQDRMVTEEGSVDSSTPNAPPQLHPHHTAQV